VRSSSASGPASRPAAVAAAGAPPHRSPTTRTSVPSRWPSSVSSGSAGEKPGSDVDLPPGLVAPVPDRPLPVQHDVGPRLSVSRLGEGPDLCRRSRRRPDAPGRRAVVRPCPGRNGGRSSTSRRGRSGPTASDPGPGGNTLSYDMLQVLETLSSGFTHPRGTDRGGAGSPRRPFASASEETRGRHASARCIVATPFLAKGRFRLHDRSVRTDGTIFRDSGNLRFPGPCTAARREQTLGTYSRMGLSVGDKKSGRRA